MGVFDLEDLFTGKTKYQMAADLHALETCDAVFLLDGWHKSVGARKELAAALRCGLKIYLAPVVYIPLIHREP